MNPTKIEWCDVTWNPVVGCKFKCSYCYAEKLHNMRHKAYMEGKLQNAPQYAKPFNEPQFIPSRLPDPSKKNKPLTIFVVSMGDLFGKWIPDEWIVKVLRIAMYNPHHKFMLLTKNPKRYNQFEFSSNVWLGATLEYSKYKDRIVQLKKASIRIPENNKKTFVSIEPLLGSFEGVDFKGIDLVIVGADSSPGAEPPKKEWIESIKHDNIFYKNNIKKYL